MPNESASSKPEQNRTTENEKNKIGISEPTNKTKANNTNTQTKIGKQNKAINQTQHHQKTKKQKQKRKMQKKQNNKRRC